MWSKSPLIGKYVIYAIVCNVIEFTLSRSPGAVQENIKIVINDDDIQKVITTCTIVYKLDFLCVLVMRARPP